MELSQKLKMDFLKRGNWKRSKHIVVRESMREIILKLSHQERLEGHKWWLRIMDNIWKSYNLWQMEADVTYTVRNFVEWEKNINLIRNLNNKLRILQDYEKVLKRWNRWIAVSYQLYQRKEIPPGDNRPIFEDETIHFSANSWSSIGSGII